MGEMGSTLLATDLDKTGYDGLVVLTPGGCGKQGTASVFLSASTATLQTDALNGPYPVNLPSEFLNPISVAAGNFTGGPYEDLVIADAGSGSPCTPYTPPSVWLFKNTTTAPGTQTFSALEEIWTPPSTIPSTQSAQVSQVLTYPYSAGRNPYLLISAFDGVHVMENVGGSPNPFKEEAVLSLYEDDPNFSYAWQLALGNFSGTSTNEVAVASNDFVYIYPLNQTTGALLPTPNYAGAAVSMPLTGTYGGYANQIVPLQRFGHLDDLMVAGESGFAALLNSGTYTPALPVVTTKVASAVSSSGGTAKATLNGLVKANNTTSQYYWFVYGTSPLAMNTSTPMVGPVTGPSATTAKATVTTLVPNTDYFFQLWASDAAGKSKGAVQSFVTPASAPTVTTDPATGVSLAGAILNGTVTANNSTTDYWFAYGTSKTALTSLTTKTPGFSGIKANPVTFALSGLKSNTTYYFQVVAANSAGTSKGSVLSFKTY
jgi:hypothetical protein